MLRVCESELPVMTYCEVAHSSPPSNCPRNANLNEETSLRCQSERNLRVKCFAALILGLLQVETITGARSENQNVHGSQTY